MLHILHLCLFMCYMPGEAFVFKSFHGGKQQCNCRNNVQCNNTTGRCPSDHCAKNYTGITCQHASVHMLNDVTFRPFPSTLRDVTHSTCVDDVFSRRHVKVNVRKPHFFFWIQVNRRETQPFNPKVSNQANSDEECTTHSYVTSSSSRLVIFQSGYCFTKKFTISDLPKDTCAVEIGVGRNLALDGEVFRVINQPVGVVFSRSKTLCPLSLTDAATAFWKISLLFEAHVNFVTILPSSAKNCVSVEKYSKDGFHISDENAKAWAVKDVHILIIDSQRPHHSECTHHTEPLCEVQVFGEFICPNNKYGALCDRTCSGCTSERCVPDWGCLDGCVIGKEGLWCDKEISDHDEGTKYTSKSTLLAQDGVTTSTPFLAQDGVTTITPSSSCKNDPECKYVCSHNCAGLGDCDKANGDCLDGCKHGFNPTNCTRPCTGGNYGLNCSEVCSGCSMNETTNEYICNAVTGNCSYGCGPGYIGKYCQMLVEPDTLLTTETIFHVIFFLFGILVILIIYNLIRKKYDPNREWDEYFEEEEGEEWGVYENADEAYWGDFAQEDAENYYVEREDEEKVIGNGNKKVFSIQQGDEKTSNEKNKNSIKEGGKEKNDGKVKDQRKEKVVQKNDGKDSIKQQNIEHATKKRDGVDSVTEQSKESVTKKKDWMGSIKEQIKEKVLKKEDMEDTFKKHRKESVFKKENGKTLIKPQSEKDGKDSFKGQSKEGVFKKAYEKESSKEQSKEDVIKKKYWMDSLRDQIQEKVFTKEDGRDSVNEHVKEHVFKEEDGKSILNEQSKEDVFTEEDGNDSIKEGSTKKAFKEEVQLDSNKEENNEKSNTIDNGID